MTNAWGDKILRVWKKLRWFKWRFIKTKTRYSRFFHHSCALIDVPIFWLYRLTLARENVFIDARSGNVIWNCLSFFSAGWHCCTTSSRYVWFRRCSYHEVNGFTRRGNQVAFDLATGKTKKPTLYTLVKRLPDILLSVWTYLSGNFLINTMFGDDVQYYCNILCIYYLFRRKIQEMQCRWHCTLVALNGLLNE